MLNKSIFCLSLLLNSIIQNSAALNDLAHIAEIIIAITSIVGILLSFYYSKKSLAELSRQRKFEMEPFISLHVGKQQLILRNSGRGVAMNITLEMVRDSEGNQVINHGFTPSDRIIFPSIGDANKNMVYLALNDNDKYIVKDYEGYQFKFSAESISKEQAFWKYQIRKIDEKRSYVEFAGYTKNESEI